MKDLINVFGNLANKAKDSGLGGLLGNAPGQDSRPEAPAAGSALSGLGNMGGLGGLLGSAALGGVLGALLTNKSTRKVAGSIGKGALVVGGGAAVAALAWKMYQGWSQGQGAAQGGQGEIAAPGQLGQTAQTGQATQAPPSALPVAEADRQGELLLRAVIFAARSDGHVDEQEQAHIERLIEAMGAGSDLTTRVEAMMREPVDPRVLVSLTRSAVEAEDV